MLSLGMPLEQGLPPPPAGAEPEARKPKKVKKGPKAKARAKALGREDPGHWKADDFDSLYVLAFEGGKLVRAKKEAEGYAE